jgi:tetratricopeptide (TPR) repeat protein
LVFAGEFRRAISVADAHMRLDPFYPGLLAGWKGWAFYFLKEYEQALPLLRECVSRMPKLEGLHAWLAAALAQCGLLDEAHRECCEILRILPSYSIGGVAKPLDRFKHAEHAEHFFEGLRKAGVPE